MPITMRCPFFSKNHQLKLHCEGATLNFPDGTARKGYIAKYCANDIHWRKCPICQYLEEYYDRKEEERDGEQG